MSPTSTGSSVRFCQGCSGCAGSDARNAPQRRGRRRHQPGLAIVRPSADPRDPRPRTPSNGWEHLALRLGPGGHPALRQKLVRRALAYGIDRVAIVRALFGDRPDATAARQRRLPEHEPHYRPNWEQATATGPHLPGGCSSRRVAGGGRRIYVCAGERLSTARRTLAGVASGNDRRARPVAAPAGRGRGPAGLHAGGAFFDQIVPSGDFDVAAFAWFGGDSIVDKSTLRLRRRSRTTRATASGW